jgi:hypothetical protein
MLFGALPCVVASVPATAPRCARTIGRPQHRADDRQDDPDGPKHWYREDEAEYEQDDSEDQHATLLSLSFTAPVPTANVNKTSFYDQICRPAQRVTRRLVVPLGSPICYGFVA